MANIGDIDLSLAARIALRKFASERGSPSLSAAAAEILEDWLIGNGYLELALDEDTETAGEA